MSIKLIATDMDEPFYETTILTIILYSQRSFANLNAIISTLLLLVDPVSHDCNVNLKTTPPRWDLFRKTVQLFI